MVAVSGGPDSTALLHLIRGVAGELDLSVTAAHFDHGVRAESAAEAEKVRGRVRDLGIPCRVGRARRDLPLRQEAFREARYAFLRRVADDLGAGRIATGHQADDQAETVLFRILRGTGLRGLAGIPPRRGPIVRPLLPFRRAEILAWLEAREIAWIDDPSNRDPRWERARIREEVLPAMEAAWGEPIRGRLLALAGAARQAERALERRAAGALRRCRVESEGAWDEGSVALALESVRELDRETASRLVRRAARGRGVRLTRGGTRAAIEFISEGRSGTSVDIGGGLSMAREFDTLWIGRPLEAAPDAPLRIGTADPGRGELRIGGRGLRASWGGAAPDSTDAVRLELATDRLAFPLIVRGWRAGDRIRTGAGTRKLKDLFREERVPASERDRIPVVVADDGSVVAVGALAAAREVRPEEGEERFVLRIEDA